MAENGSKNIHDVHTGDRQNPFGMETTASYSPPPTNPIDIPTTPEDGKLRSILERLAQKVKPVAEQATVQLKKSKEWYDHRLDVIEARKLNERLSELFAKELGTPPIDDLTPREQMNGKAFMRIYNKPDQALRIIKKVGGVGVTLLSDIKGKMGERWVQRVQDIEDNDDGSSIKKRERSSFDIYANLNLNGTKDERMRKASRFAHMIFAEPSDNPDHTSIMPLDPQEVKNILIETFTNPAHKFPWKDKDGKPITDDPRVDCINFEATQVVDYPDNIPDNFSQHAKDAPLIIRLNGKSSEDLLTNPENSNTCLRNLVDNHPFVIIIDKNGRPFNAESGDKPGYLFNIISNHQYLDGVPSSYYLNRFIQNLGLNSVAFRMANANLIHETFQKTDKRENSLSPTDSYSIKSTLTSPELMDTFLNLYDKVSTYWEAQGIYIDQKDFLQLALLNRTGINGTSRRAGVLQFDQNASEQLGHCDIGNVAGIFAELCALDGSKKTLKKLKAAFRPYVVKSTAKNGEQIKKQFLRLDLYSPKKNNVANIISVVKNTVPSFLHASINELTKKGGILRYIIGQDMCSVVPEGMKIMNQSGVMKYIDFGGGVGGPACTEVQQHAQTVAYQRDSEGRMVIIVREKTE